MTSLFEQLRHLGWDEWFEAHAAEEGIEIHQLARVIAVDREQFLVMDGSGEYRAKLSGRFLHTAGETTGFPCVGDWVSMHYGSSDMFAIVHDVIPRKSFLRRKAAGESIDYQMIAANIDVALLVQSCHFDFNVNRLERYLVMVRNGHVRPVIVLTKTDLVSAETLRQLKESIRHAGITVEIITVSNVSGDGIDSLGAMLQPGKTYCLLGSSGVGKSTLLNRLLGSHLLETAMVSGTGEGRHTTVRRELIRLQNGALLIDNPGMRECGIIGADEGMGESFADIHELAATCKYADCSHANEPGCAVLRAIAEGSLQQAHYLNFLKLRSEAEFHDLSYLEKRKKDKDFGRYIKSVKKDLGMTRRR